MNCRIRGPLDPCRLSVSLVLGLVSGDTFSGFRHLAGIGIKRKVEDFAQITYTFINSSVEKMDSGIRGAGNVATVGFIITYGS